MDIFILTPLEGEKGYGKKANNYQHLVWKFLDYFIISFLNVNFKNNKNNYQHLGVKIV